MAWCLDCHNSPEDFMFEMKGYEDEEPRNQIFALYEKYIEGKRLSPVEHMIMEGKAGDLVKIPDDKDHDGLKIIEERKINATQLTECYTCHR